MATRSCTSLHRVGSTFARCQSPNRSRFQVQGATASLASPATLAMWICNLQNLQEARGFESHPLRQILAFRFKNLQLTQKFPVQRSLVPAFACVENRPETVKWADLLRCVPLLFCWNSRQRQLLALSPRDTSGSSRLAHDSQHRCQLAGVAGTIAVTAPLSVTPDSRRTSAGTRRSAPTRIRLCRPCARRQLSAAYRQRRQRAGCQIR